jgi:SAM-dependent methyltransferase/tetratricopeptide (TPR) repeat protein
MNRKERRAAGKRSRTFEALTPKFSGDALALADLMANARRYYQQGQPAQAEAICNDILARAPSHVHSLNLLGVIAQASGRHKLAVKVLAKAIASDPLSAACHYNIASSYLILNRRDEAAVHFKQAIVLGMDAKNIEDFILQNPLIAACIERIDEKWPLPVSTDPLFAASSLRSIADDVFLRCALVSTIIRGVVLERFLTQLRASLLQLTSESGIQSEMFDGVLVNLFCAVAQQCFINEYVFALSDEEMRRASQQKKLLLEKIESDDLIPPSLLTAVAAYYPLHTLPMAEALVSRDWPETVIDLVRQQIREPFEEVQDRSSIPVLTTVEDGISLQVMRQYEENPYPRWTINPLTVLAGDRIMQIESSVNNENPNVDKEILIAGCGSGQHAFHTAQSFPHSRILAVDISLPSLAYARRKTREEGLRNIEYAQADILKLRTIGRIFDRVESVGVLHHLAEPETGWRVLLDLLRPGGEMLIGLYSEIARRSVVEARALIAERGYRPTIEDIRKCRQDILREGDKRNWNIVTTTADFYSSSGCRDLLFNIMEHRFTIPKIKTFLDEHNLTFLGFELEPSIVEKFQNRFPGPTALTDLNSWHAFEVDNPKTFRQMYIFNALKN